MRSSRTSRSFAALLKRLHPSKFISLLCAVTLCCGLLPSSAFAAQDSHSLVPEGETGAVPIASGAEGGVPDAVSHYASDEPSSVDGDGAASTSENVIDIEGTMEDPAFINQDVELTTVVAQAESTKSFFLAQTLESTRTVPVVSASLPVDTSHSGISTKGSDDEYGGEISCASMVVGSFEYRGITYAVEPGGDSVAVVASDYSKLPEDFLEAKIIVLPSRVTVNGIDYYSVARIVDNVFVSFQQTNSSKEGVASTEDVEGITAITIPASVLTIEDNAFTGFDTLQRVIVSSDNQNYSAYDGCLYTVDQTSLLFIPEGRTGAVYIAPNAIEIDSEMLSHCSSLEIFVADTEGTAYKLFKEFCARGGMQNYSVTTGDASQFVNLQISSDYSRTLELGMETGFDQSSVLDKTILEGSSDLMYAVSSGEIVCTPDGKLSFVGTVVNCELGIVFVHDYEKRYVVVSIRNACEEYTALQTDSSRMAYAASAFSEQGTINSSTLHQGKSYSTITIVNPSRSRSLFVSWGYINYGANWGGTHPAMGEAGRQLTAEIKPGASDKLWNLNDDSHRYEKWGFDTSGQNSITAYHVYYPSSATFNTVRYSLAVSFSKNGTPLAVTKLLDSSNNEVTSGNLTAGNTYVIAEVGGTSILDFKEQGTINSSTLHQGKSYSTITIVNPSRSRSLFVSWGYINYGDTWFGTHPAMGVAGRQLTAEIKPGASDKLWNLNDDSHRLEQWGFDTSGQNSITAYHVYYPSSATFNTVHYSLAVSFSKNGTPLAVTKLLDSFYNEVTSGRLTAGNTYVIAEVGGTSLADTTVTWNSMGGSDVTAWTTFANCRLGNYSTNALPEPTRVGYRFNGWYTCDSETIESNEVTVDTIPLEDITYYASWKRLRNKISWSDRDLELLSSEADYGTSVTMLDAFEERSAYTFEGWMASTDGVVYAGGSSDFTMSDEDVTFSAVWKLKPCTVVFDPGTGNASEIVAVQPSPEPESSFMIPTPVARGKGYVFSHWGISDDDEDNLWYAGKPLTVEGILAGGYPEADVLASEEIAGTAYHNVITLHAVWNPTISVSTPLVVTMAIDPDTGEMIAGEGYISTTGTSEVSVLSLAYDKTDPSSLGGGTNAVFGGSANGISLTMASVRDDASDIESAFGSAPSFSLDLGSQDGTPVTDSTLSAFPTFGNGVSLRIRYGLSFPTGFDISSLASSLPDKTDTAEGSSWSRESYPIANLHYTVGIVPST